MAENISKSCKECSQSFEILPEDLTFYKKIGVPEPTCCPDCRQQKRLAFRNEKNLYKRSCDLCGVGIISFFDKNVDFPVYCSKCWWSDKWDPFSYGKDFDFSRPFFEQFKELTRKVPKICALQLNNENCDFNALIAFSKNAYMSPGSYVIEDSYYLRKSQYCKDCANSNFLDHCELVCASVNCNNCYSCSNLIDCRNCSDCHYVAHASGCQNCYMCSNIVSKKFAFKNVTYPEAEYRSILEKYRNKTQEELAQEFREFIVTLPKKYQNQINCENSSGDYIQNCKNAQNCFDCFDIEDSRNLIESVDVKDSMDLSMHDKEIELCYECCSGGEKNYNLKFAFCTIASPNSSYMYSCFYAADCFGCDGFHSKVKNCILNKQYSEADYKILAGKIIEHMKKTGEFGEFFPISLSPYGYNDSGAQDFIPLKREDALNRGFNWKEKDPTQYRPAPKLTERNPEKLPDTVAKEIFACSSCGKNFQVLIQELKLFKRMKQPLSALCGNCRFIELSKLKNPRKLWERKCDKCGIDLKSTYPANSQDKVYCEKCYLETI
jgi:hypothetical protein